MADADALGDDHTTFIKAEGMPTLSRAAFQMHTFAGINSIQDGRSGFVSDEYLNAITAETTTTVLELEAVTALDDSGLPASGGERRVVRLGASLADGIPVDLRDAFTGMDAANVGSAVRAILHASGHRKERWKLRKAMVRRLPAMSTVRYRKHSGPSGDLIIR